MQDNGETGSTISERAYQTWAIRPPHSSDQNVVRPRLTDVRTGSRKASALILTEELEKMIQTALALGCGHQYAIQNVKKQKHELLLKRADNTGTIASIKHRWDVKCLEIQPNRDPTEQQKKTLDKLGQDLERLKYNQTLIDDRLAALEKSFARGMNSWRKAWTDVGKILVEVWRDAGRLRTDDDYDTDDRKPTEDCNMKDKEARKRARPNGDNGEDAPVIPSGSDRAEQRQAKRRWSDISEWQHSVENEPPSPIISQHSNTYPQGQRTYGNGDPVPRETRRHEFGRDMHQERHRTSRSRSRRHDRDASRHQGGAHGDYQQHRTRNGSARGRRSRNAPEHDSRSDSR
jgi:hypothetical protein